MATMKNILEQKGYTFWFVSPEEKVGDCLKRLAEKRVGAVLVMDGETLCGIFSERDVVTLLANQGPAVLDTPVGEVMTSQVLGVKLETTVDECMALMTTKRFRHVPVMDGSLVVGIVSIGDIVKEVIRDQEIIIRGMEVFLANRDFPT